MNRGKIVYLTTSEKSELFHTKQANIELTIIKVHE